MMKWINENGIILILAIIFISISYGSLLFPIDIGFGKYISYILFYIGVYFISSTLPNKSFLKLIKSIIEFPAIIIILFEPLYLIIVFLFLSIITPFILIFNTYYLILKLILNLNITDSTLLYLILITGSIITTQCVEKIIYKFSNLIYKFKSNSHRSKRIELILSIINSNRIRFFIYTMYFIYLVVYALSSLNKHNIFDNPNISIAVLYSFATFIAYERILLNYNLLDFNIFRFFDKLQNVWKNDDDFKT